MCFRLYLIVFVKCLKYRKSTGKKCDKILGYVFFFFCNSLVTLGRFSENDKTHLTVRCRVHMMCLYGKWHDLGIHGFSSTRPCLIMQNLATQEKFLRSFGHFSEINSAFTFRHTTNVFACFRGVYDPV